MPLVLVSSSLHHALVLCCPGLLRSNQGWSSARPPAQSRQYRGPLSVRGQTSLLPFTWKRGRWLLLPFHSSPARPVSVSPSTPVSVLHHLACLEHRHLLSRRWTAREDHQPRPPPSSMESSGLHPQSTAFSFTCLRAHARGRSTSRSQVTRSTHFPLSGTSCPYSPDVTTATSSPLAAPYLSSSSGLPRHCALNTWVATILVSGYNHTSWQTTQKYHQKGGRGLWRTPLTLRSRRATQESTG